MSEDNSNDITTTNEPTHSTKRTKREEIFGFPKDDVILGVAAAGLGLAGLVGGKMIYDMIQNGQIQNPLAPQNSRISYSDVYEQQRAQQAYEAQQAAQAQQQAQPVQQQPELDFQEPEGGDPSAQTMPAFAGFDDGDDGVSYSTTVRKPGTRFDRINGG